MHWSISNRDQANFLMNLRRLVIGFCDSQKLLLINTLAVSSYFDALAFTLTKNKIIRKIC